MTINEMIKQMQQNGANTGEKWLHLSDSVPNIGDVVYVVTDDECLLMATYCGDGQFKSVVGDDYFSADEICSWKASKELIE